MEQPRDETQNGTQNEVPFEQFVQERNRLIGKMLKQSPEVKEDIAILAVALAYALADGHSDSKLRTNLLGLRIMQLAEGEYGAGVCMSATGSMDTSADAVLGDLRAKAEAAGREDAN
jgi:hypothetical protein